MVGKVFICLFAIFSLVLMVCFYAGIVAGKQADIGIP